MTRFRNHPLWPTLAKGCVLALSGGPDSAVLLDLCLRTGIPPERLVVAHLDHGLRPDSQDETGFVAERARQAGVEFRCRRVDVAERARRDGTGLEGAGRDLRYAFLEEVSRETGYAAVATAHHRDDQAETVILQLLRGCGPTGLRGIRPVRSLTPGSPIRLIRPLLEMTKAAIVEHADARGLAYLDDPTNHDGSNLRSVVRTHLLPGLTADLPEVSERLAAVADRARALGE